MSNSIKVSIVIPIYNVEKQLNRCIESVINQTYSNLEIILCNDGSTDSSALICDQYKAIDSRILVIHKENEGVSKARNTALEYVSGEYVIFLDGDDSLERNTIEVCVSNLNQEKYDIVEFGYHMYLEDDTQQKIIGDMRREPCVINSAKELSKNFVKYEKAGYLGFVTDKCIRVSLIKNAKVRFDSYYDMGGEDAIFILSLLPHVNSMIVIDNCLYNYYRRDNLSTTVTFNVGKFDRYYDRLILTQQYLLHQGIDDIEFLIRKYCTYILWVYESMFSSSCGLSLIERYKYLRNAFVKKELQSGFYSEVLNYLSHEDFLNDYSRSSKIALELILKKRYLLLMLLHIVTLLKIRRSKNA